MESIRSAGVRSRREVLTAAAGGMASLAFGASARAEATAERAELRAAFAREGVAGTFALYDVQKRELTLVDAERAAARCVPASTFKIANSLIALETGVVKDENEVIPYGGKPQPFKTWETDMPMREAIAMSNVPIYQEIARRVGLERYRVWLDRLGYGNRQTGDAVDTFWLDGPLEISAIEQARFVAQLAQNRLPVSDRSQQIVRSIIRLEQRAGRTLYGKTGWRFSSTPQLGWWTGWVDEGGKIATFALHIDMPSPNDAPKRVAIGKRLLGELGVF
jgi:beta-lactamase class D